MTGGQAGRHSVSRALQLHHETLFLKNEEQEPSAVLRSSISSCLDASKTSCFVHKENYNKYTLSGSAVLPWRCASFSQPVY